MAARLRRLLLSLPVLIAAGLLLGYLLLAWFAFEPLLKWGAPRYLAEHGGYRLSLDRARFNPFTLSVELRGLGLNEPAGKPLLAVQRLFVDFNSWGVFRRAYAFDALQIERPVVHVELLADGQLNWLRFADALSAGQPAEPAPPPERQMTRLLLRQLAVDKARVEFIDRTVAGGFQVQFDPLEFRLDELSTLPEDKGAYSLLAHTAIGADLQWRGSLALNPLAASGELAISKLALGKLWPYLQSHLNTAPPAGEAQLSLRYQASYEKQRLQLLMDQVEARVDGLALRGKKDAQPALALGRLSLRGGRLDLAKRELSAQGLDLKGGRIAVALAADGRPDLLDWLTPPAADTPSAAASAPAPAASSAPPWNLSLQRASVDGLALQLLDHGFAQPLQVDLAALKLGLQARLRTGGDGGPPDLALTDVQARLDGLRLQSGAGAGAGTAKPWFQLGSIGVEGGELQLAKKQVNLGRLAFSEGQLALTRDARGELPLRAALQRRAAVGAPAAAAAAAATRDAAAWHYRIGKIVADKFQARLSDESTQPATTLALQDIQAEADGFSDDPKASLPLRLSLRAGEGGQLSVSGRLQPALPAADLQIKLQGLSLLPARGPLAQLAALNLERGLLDVDGRLLYAKAQPSFEGSFALRELLIRETESKERFLAWKRLGSRKLVLTPQGLKMGVLELDGLGAKLIIFKDKTVNVVKVFRPRAEGAIAAAAPAPATRPPFQVDIGRIRFDRSEMEFADLSLALPFGTHVHDLKGYVVGLSTTPGSRARLELDGQVDEYGMASAKGTLKPGDPTDAMDIKLLFKNVEMSSLTPYSATFAGRRISSGKLSLDLDYKLQQRQLKGENQIVMDQLTLGERVPGSEAPNLPLDLAIAILQDSDGKIDLGLPVSGSLDDPQFSVGGIVWKAFTNVLGKIVTAPFRALGALFGGGGAGDGERRSEIVFAAGEAGLQPPEREKLDQLAAQLGKRPALALEVAGSFDPAADKTALQDMSLRREVARQMGREIPVDRNPGPVGTQRPEAQKALEQLYMKRFGAAGLEQLRTQFQQANPDAPRPGGVGALWSTVQGAFKAAPPPLSEAEASALRGKELYPLMRDRLQAAEPIGEPQLQALGRQRAEAIRDQVLSRGIAAERVRLQPSEARPGKSADAGEMGEAGGVGGVRTALKLAVAASAAAAPAASQAAR
ncbi:MAG: DUF748 domain-containing protein [Burkholderiaceae bacterium]